MAAETQVQRYDLTVRGRHHRVEVEGSVSRTIRWYVDEDLVATKRSTEDKVTLEVEPDGEEASARPVDQVIGLAFSVRGRAKRVTLFEAEDDVPAKARAVLGRGGIDLDPEPGSPAARREQRIREHPWRHAAVATAGGVAKVVVPLLLGLLAVNFAVRLPWPSWDVPWPDIDLPRIPWPDVPWPDIDLPDWQAPAWLRWVLDKLGYVWPIVLAFLFARGEVKRRRRQDQLKAEMRGAAEPATDGNRQVRAEDHDGGKRPERDSG